MISSDCRHYGRPRLSVVVPLALLQVALSVVVLCLMAFYFLPLGPLIAVLSAGGIHVIVLASTMLLSKHVPRVARLWAVCFALAPAVMTPLAAYEYFVNQTRYAFGFWWSFTVSLFAACYVGAVIGVIWLDESSSDELSG